MPRRPRSPGPEPPPINVMAKPVCGTCNLACDYCYYAPKTALYPGTDRFLMPEAVLIEYVKQYMEAQPRRVTFSWQGGEPLLAGLGFFRRALALQEESRRPGQEVANTLQTNGTLLDEEWARFLAEQGFLVGLSLDGPPAVHDRHRSDRGGRGSFAAAWRGWELLRRHGAACNVLVTLNRDNVGLGAELYRFFVARGVEWLQFIPILERDEAGRPREWSCPPEAYGEFLCDVFDTWVVNDLGRIGVRLFESTVSLLAAGAATVCCLAPRCANAAVLEFNGDLYACDHFVLPEWRLGNILERPLGDLMRSERMREFGRLKTDLPRECPECPFLGLCHGGCPKHHQPAGEGAKENWFCPSYRRFFAHAGEALRRIAAEVAPRPPPAARRNDPCPCGSGRKFKHCCGGQDRLNPPRPAPSTPPGRPS